MSSNGPAQASEMPLNMSEYVNFDFDFEAPRHSNGVPQETSVVEPPREIGIEIPSAGFVDADDTDFTGLFQLPDGSNALGDGLTTNAGQRTQEHCDSDNAHEAPTVAPTSLDGFPALAPMQEDYGATNAFENPIDTHPSLCDSAALNLDSGNPDIADAFPRTIEQEPSNRVPLNLENQREPSRWVPVSPPVQHYLNMVYASQLTQNLADRHPAPVLYFPAQEPFASPMSSISPLPKDGIPQHVFSHMPQLTSIDPSLLMPENTSPPPQKPLSNGNHSPFSSITDDKVPKAEGAALSLTKKRALDADESDCESVPKRTRTALAEQLLTVAKYEESDDESDDESKDDSEDNSGDDPNNESIDSDSSACPPASPSQILPPTLVARKNPPAIPSSNATAKKGPYWRYEQAKEVRLRDQRKKQWNRRRVNPHNAKGKALNRKMQRLLEEIEDTEGFAEAQGYNVEESVESDKDREFVPRRSTRRGARKSFVGQE